jgi:hypothetical protein
MAVSSWIAAIRLFALPALIPPPVILSIGGF